MKAAEQFRAQDPRSASFSHSSGVFSSSFSHLLTYLKMEKCRRWSEMPHSSAISFTSILINRWNIIGGSVLIHTAQREITLSNS